MRAWLIHTLGGIDVTSPNEEERQKILSLAIERLFNTVGKDDILKANKDGSWDFAQKTLTPFQVNALRKEAEAILNSRMWSVLVKDLRYWGNKKEDEATTLFQLESAKLLKFIVDIMLTRLEKVRSLPQLPEA